MTATTELPGADTDVDIGADVNPGGAGVWELPGLGEA